MRPRSPNRRQQQFRRCRRGGIVGAAGILVGQDVRDIDDVVEKFTGAPRVPVTSRSGASKWAWGPPLHRPATPGPTRAASVGRLVTVGLARASSRALST